MIYKVSKYDGMWIGVVFDDTDVPYTALTVCSEISKQLAIDWCKHYINTGIELPDAYDRKH